MRFNKRVKHSRSISLPKTLSTDLVFFRMRGKLHSIYVLVVESGMNLLTENHEYFGFSLSVWIKGDVTLFLLPPRNIYFTPETQPTSIKCIHLSSSKHEHLFNSLNYACNFWKINASYYFNSLEVQKFSSLSVFEKIRRAQLWSLMSCL